MRRKRLQGWATSAPLAAEPELWAHCPRCDRWFLVDDPGLAALLLCPADLHRSDISEVRLPA